VGRDSIASFHGGGRRPGAVHDRRAERRERVHWTPEEIAALVRLLRAEGASRVQAAELAQIVHSESRALHLDPLYALALIKIESNFRANAVSSHGAVGLLQIRPEAARSVAIAGESATGETPRAARLRDPQTNVAVGLRYLRHLEGQFLDRTTALAAYNLGPSRVRRQLERGAPVPRAYAERVLAVYRALAEATTTSPDGAPSPSS
jgi:soluble lytic murein transglycosylase-like protein